MASAYPNIAENSKVVVSGRGVDIGDSLNGHVETQMKSIAAKYFGVAMDCSVILRKGSKGSNFQCGVHVRLGHGIHFDGAAEHHNAYSAFNGAAEHIAKQLRRLKREMREDKPVSELKDTLFSEHNRRVVADEFAAL